MLNMDNLLHLAVNLMNILWTDTYQNFMHILPLILASVRAQNFSQFFRNRFGFLKNKVLGIDRF